VHATPLWGGGGASRSPILCVGFSRPRDSVREDPGPREAALEALQVGKLLALVDVVGSPLKQHLTTTTQSQLPRLLHRVPISTQLQ